MKLLVARKNARGGFEKVGVAQLTKDGSRVVRMPKAIQPGSVEYRWVRDAGRWIAGERIKPSSLDFEHGTISVRVSVIDGPECPCCGHSLKPFSATYLDCGECHGRFYEENGVLVETA